MSIFFTAAQNWTPEVDLEKRILRNAVIATSGMASDGWIVIPQGVDTSSYLLNPIVTARHLALPADVDIVRPDATPVVMARTLAINAGPMEVITELQFADTDLGRDYAYLYGVNPRKEAYMRAWSIEGSIIEATRATFPEAQRLAGQYWNQDMADRIRRDQPFVKVALRFGLNAYASVALGADRSALTRADGEGIHAAKLIMTRLDLAEARAAIAEISGTMFKAEVAHLNRQMQALVRDGAAAAGQGDSAALLNEVRELLRKANATTRKGD